MTIVPITPHFLLMRASGVHSESGVFLLVVFTRVPGSSGGHFFVGFLMLITFALFGGQPDHPSGRSRQPEPEHDVEHSTQRRLMTRPVTKGKAFPVPRMISGNEREHEPRDGPRRDRHEILHGHLLDRRESGDYGASFRKLEIRLLEPIHAPRPSPTEGSRQPLGHELLNHFLSDGASLQRSNHQDFKGLPFPLGERAEGPWCTGSPHDSAWPPSRERRLSSDRETRTAHHRAPRVKSQMQKLRTRRPPRPSPTKNPPNQEGLWSFPSHSFTLALGTSITSAPSEPRSRTGRRGHSTGRTSTRDHRPISGRASSEIQGLDGPLGSSGFRPCAWHAHGAARPCRRRGRDRFSQGASRRSPGLPGHGRCGASPRDSPPRPGPSGRARPGPRS